MPRDNPRIKQNGPVQEGLRESKQAEVKTPRSFKGSDFQDFPRLVVQINRPRPRPRVDKQPDTPPESPSGEPSEGFARPLRGMGVGRYDDLRSQMQPQMDSYRTAVHDAYADNTITPEERKGLRQQRRGLRQDVRQYRSSHPLQMGLGARVREMAQGDREGGIGPQVKQMAKPEPSLPKMGGISGDIARPSMERLRQLQELWKAGHIAPEQLLAALGFTGKLPEGGGSNNG